MGGLNQWRGGFKGFGDVKLSSPGPKFLTFRLPCADSTVTRLDS